MSQRHLSPGDLFVTTDPLWVTTLLGSCVAVTMFSRRLHLAAICHGMLPGPREETKSDCHDPNRFRFLSYAIPAMVDRFRSCGLKVREIEVKMFGGGNVLQTGSDDSIGTSVGAVNVAAARLLLRHARMNILSENVGGDRGSKIAFNTQTGEVLHKHLSAEHIIRGRTS